VCGPIQSPLPHRRIERAGKGKRSSGNIRAPL
jgi:hypothetical protein